MLNSSSISNTLRLSQIPKVGFKEVKSESFSVLSDSLQSMDCNPPGSSVCGILQARVLEWVAIPFSRGSSQPRDRSGSPALQADSLQSEPLEKPMYICIKHQKSDKITFFDSKLFLFLVEN